MKTKDQVLLEEAYLKVASQQEVIEEKSLEHNEHSSHSMIARTNSPEMDTLAKAQEAYEAAIDLIRTGKELPDKMLKAIIADPSIAARCAQLMALEKKDLPKELRAVVGDVDKVMKSSLMGP
jgi:hypothetical protein